MKATALKSIIEDLEANEILSVTICTADHRIVVDYEQGDEVEVDTDNNIIHINSDGSYWIDCAAIISVEI